MVSKLTEERVCGGVSRAEVWAGPVGKSFDVDVVFVARVEGIRIRLWPSQEIDRGGRKRLRRAEKTMSVARCIGVGYLVSRFRRSDPRFRQVVRV